MKKLLSTLFILMLALCALTACGCEHLDKNDDGKCDECGDKFTDGTDVPVTPPSCQHRDADDNGKCDKCGEDYTDGPESTTDHTHTWTLSQTTDASCNANGEKIFTCSCGERKSESILMIGHSMENGMCSVCKRTESAGLKFILSKDKSYYLVAGLGSCTDTDLIIPSTYNNLPVKEIDDYAFRDREQIVSVTILEGITKIGGLAFGECSNLVRITLPKTLEYIDVCGFNACSSLVSINIPEKTKLGEFAFGNCTSLETIYVHENNEFYASIDGVLYEIDYAYTEKNEPIAIGTITLIQYPSGRKNEVFELPDHATCIWDSGFQSALYLKQIRFHENLLSIGDHAFSGCASLEEIAFPNSVRYMGNFGFIGCKNLKTVRYGKNFVSPGCDFNGCTSLERFEVHEENQYYSTIDGNLYSKDGSQLYKYCNAKKETSFTIPDSVTIIREYAFMGAIYLEKIEIKKSVSQIYRLAFAYCENLNSINYSGTVAEWNKIKLESPLEGYGEKTVEEITCSDGNVKIK